MPEEKEKIEAPVVVPNTEEASIAAALAADTDYQEMVEEEKTNQGDDDGEVQDGREGNEENEEGSEEAGEENGSGEEEPVLESEFQDNIIPGLKGDKFAALDDEVKTTVAKTRETLDLVSSENAKLKETLDALLKDPVVQSRKEAQESGQANETYSIPKVGDSDLDEFIKLVDADTPESRAQFKAKLEGFMTRSANIGADNTRISNQVADQVKATNRKAGENLLALSKLSKNLNTDITDPEFLVKSAKLDDLGDLGVVIKDLIASQQKGHIGNVLKYLAETPANEIYAAQAAKHGWPLVINADAKIREHVKASNKKLFEKFLKGNPSEASGTLPKGSSLDNKAIESGVIRDGINIVKLATSDTYHESVLYSKQSKEWIDKVSELRTEGERLIAKNPRLIPPSSKHT